jgi:hypothetical protein
MTITKVNPITSILELNNNKRPNQQRIKTSNKKNINNFYKILEDTIKKQGGNNNE